MWSIFQDAAKAHSYRDRGEEEAVRSYNPNILSLEHSKLLKCFQ